MSKSFKTVCSVALALVLTFGAIVPAKAASLSTTSKDEVVYVKLNNDGSLESIYVVNGFVMTEGGEIADRGQYSNITNLSTKDQIITQGNLISANVPKGNFYYQGQLENRDIPWNISIAYYLDGKQITGDELAGRSGELKINIGIRQADSANKFFCDNFALQASLSLDSTKCKNIVAPDATIATSGNRKQISLTVMPGVDKELSVTADVTDFTFDGVLVNAIPFSMNIEFPDMSNLTDKVFELQDGIIRLNDGVKELGDGTTELIQGVNDLESGVYDLRNGVNELSSGATELKEGALGAMNGALDLESGAYKLYDAAGELSDGTTSIRTGAQNLSSGASTFSQALSDLNGKSSFLNSGADALSSGIATLAQNLASIDTTALAGLGTSAGELATASQQYANGLDALIATYTDAGDSETVALLTGLRDNYMGINTGVANLASAVSGQTNPVDGLASGVEPLVQAAAELKDGVHAYTSGVNRLYGSFGSIQSGISSIHSGADSLYGGTQDMRSGMGDLYDGARDLSQGMVTLYNGAVSLADGTATLYDAVGELENGVVSLKDGAGQLADGTTELLDGTNELRDETAGLDIEGRINEKLEEYQRSDIDLVSFVDQSNTHIKSLQFVIKTDEIEISKPMAQAEPEPTKTTLWQRFLALFTFGKED